MVLESKSNSEEVGPFENELFLEIFEDYDFLFKDIPQSIKNFNFFLTYNRTKTSGLTKDIILQQLKNNFLKDDYQIIKYFLCEEKYSNLDDTHIHIYIELDKRLNCRKKKLFDSYLTITIENSFGIQKKYPFNQPISNHNLQSVPNILSYLQKEDLNFLTNIQHLPPKKILTKFSNSIPLTENPFKDRQISTEGKEDSSKIIPFHENQTLENNVFKIIQEESKKIILIKNIGNRAQLNINLLEKECINNNIPTQYINADYKFFHLVTKPTEKPDFVFFQFLPQMLVTDFLFSMFREESFVFPKKIKNKYIEIPYSRFTKFIILTDESNMLYEELDKIIPNIENYMSSYNLDKNKIVINLGDNINNNTINNYYGTTQITPQLKETLKEELKQELKQELKEELKEELKDEIRKDLENEFDRKLEMKLKEFQEQFLKSNLQITPTKQITPTNQKTEYDVNVLNKIPEDYDFRN